MATLRSRLLALGKLLKARPSTGVRHFSVTAPVRSANFHPQQYGVPVSTMPFDVGENRGKFTFNYSFYLLVGFNAAFYLLLWQIMKKAGGRKDVDKQKYCAKCREICDCCWDENER